MSTPQQKQQPGKTRERKQLAERRFIIATVAILFLLGGAILWILNSQGIIIGSWSNILLIIFTVLGVLIGLFQWLFPITSSSPQQHLTAPAALPAPQIIVHVPPTAISPSQAPAGDKAAYRGILGITSTH